MLSNAYFLAKSRFDTAENEPAKNLQNFRFYEFPITEGEAAAEGGEGKSSRRWAHRAGPDDY